MDRKPTTPADPSGEARSIPARKRQKGRRPYVENEGLVSKNPREAAGAPDGEDSRALQESRAAEQRGRTP